jgi:hypothetical protein
MNTAARLGGYAGALAVSFGAAFANFTVREGST